MANRSYLYALNNRPESYQDRPDTITGLSEWPYDVPFFHRLLLSEDTSRCASLISDGLEDDDLENPTPLYAISGVAEPALERAFWFLGLLERAVNDKKPLTLVQSLARAFGLRKHQEETANEEAPMLVQSIVETREFLEKHSDSHFLLETIELDLMTTSEPNQLRQMADEEVSKCRAAGNAVEALRRLESGAEQQLREATSSGSGVLAPFKGMVLTDDFDNTRDNRTQNPVGIGSWSDILYFELLDKQSFEAHQGTNP